MSRTKTTPMITDSNQVCLAKITGRRVQEELCWLEEGLSSNILRGGIAIHGRKTYGGLKKGGGMEEKFCLTREYHWAIFLGMVFGFFCFRLGNTCSRDPIGSTSKQ